MLSSRSKRFPVDMDYISNYSVVPALKDPFDEKTNPEGIINFGTAVSSLMDDVWLKRFSQQEFFIPSQSHYRYYQFWGSDEFLGCLAKFMTTFFKPRDLIEAENLYILNGALLSLDILSCLLADEGECFIYLMPGYGGYLQAGIQRWGTRMVPVPLTLNEKSEELFELTINSVEKVISDEDSKGRKVKAFVFNNPQNPLGKVFQPEIIKEIMKMCQRRGIHLIADEIYCMSVFDEKADFHSVLEIYQPGLMDSNLLHVIWGFSKDLCLTSFRTGVIHTTNQELQSVLKSGAQFQAVPLPIMHILQKVITDVDWFKIEFVPTNHSRLREAYEKCKGFFREANFITTTTKAGFFFLVDFRPLFNPPCQKSTKAFIKHLYENKVYLTPSWDIGAEDGWFRFVFTGYATNGLDIGLKRLTTAIKKWRELEIVES